MPNQRPVVVGIIVFALLMSLFGATSAEARRDELIVGTNVDITAANPLIQNDQPTFNALFNNFYEHLLWRDPDTFQLEPLLATGYELLDEHTWRFTLRDDVTFHNGEPFTAESVKFTIEWIADPENGAAHRSYVEPIEEVKIINDYEVHLITKEPWPLLDLRVAAFIPMLPPAYIAEHGMDYFNQNPIGTGPYLWGSWQKDERLTLHANPNYWGEQPKINTLVFKPIPESMSRVTQLSTGEVDIITNISPDQVFMIRSGASAVPIQSARSQYIVLDTLSDTPLRHKEVRQALNYAVDVETIVDMVLGGYGHERAVPGTPLHFGFDETIEPYSYDPEKAKQLLAEAGYPDGFSVTFHSPSGRYLQDVEVVQAVAAYLADVGVEVNIQVYEWARYSQLLTAKTAGPMHLLGWAGILDMSGTLEPLLRTDGTYSYWANERFTDLIDAAGESVDQAERRDMFEEALAIVKEEAPYLFLFNQTDIYGVSDALDWTPRSDEYTALRDANWKQ